jgi:enediyne polyketide synthase
MSHTIAIVGMACRYPDARTPMELWENALAGRRAFRRMPPERLRLEDYLSTDRNTPDSIYSSQAALIEGYEFDRVRYRVAGGTFRSADLVHWLALDIASQSLDDAGFIEGRGLPGETTGVVLGNTLTGEFSRANTLSLRWPYVRRRVGAALAEEGWPAEKSQQFLSSLESAFKQPFPTVGEESLAGGLSNTIAGRICNHFDLKGGGYTVDGACASSLLAVSTACSILAAGDLDVAIAGGVDLSMDPFELVGFAKTGALAADRMRVYDARSAGFWPGEGCGFVVLMRYEDALAEGHRVYAVIHGWGVSSDGNGGITRPEVAGQLLAMRRAYARAGYGINSVTYFEGHGTGTSVGDTTELKTLSQALRQAGAKPSQSAISSIKANIGHTKAAAGIAGLIKATMAVNTQILPPMTGYDEPHAEIKRADSPIRILREGELWPADRPLRASVSAMGFGGINSHVTLEGTATERRKRIGAREQALLKSAPDVEVFLFGAASRNDLLEQVEHLLSFAARISMAEMSDLGAALEKRLEEDFVRAAVVASMPAELAKGLETLYSWLIDGRERCLDSEKGVFLGGAGDPRIGFLFPGQGAPAHEDSGALGRRFNFVQELYEDAGLARGGDKVATEVAQPAIVTASMAGLRALEHFGIEACVAVGHSLGELTALHWAGAYDAAALLRIAAARGNAMSKLGSPTGAMASIKAGAAEVRALLNGDAIVIAGLNSPSQTVISGNGEQVTALLAKLRSKNIAAVKLAVSHAFHSPLVAAAAPALAHHLDGEQFSSLQREVVSTVTGDRLAYDANLSALLYQQVTSPVQFIAAVNKAAEGLELLIEVGPHQVLKGLVSEFTDLPVIAIDAGGASLKGLLLAVSAAYALGAPIDHKALFAGRFTRPFELDWRPKFFVNPCELAPILDGETVWAIPQATESPEPEAIASDVRPGNPGELSIAEIVRGLVAERAELPVSAVADDDRLLGDLHLNSITVSQLVVEAAKRLQLPPPVALTDYSAVPVSEIARALEELGNMGEASAAASQQPSGVDAWIRCFTIDLIERPLPRLQSTATQGNWQVFAPDEWTFGAQLAQSLEAVGGNGVAVCLPADVDERHLGLLLKGAQAVFEREAEKFVLVQQGRSAAGLARTLHMEAPQVNTCVVNVPLIDPKTIAWIAQEAKAATGYCEVFYDEAGKRREPVLKLLEESDKLEKLPLGPEDVLLVSGGGKGIAAECALALARETGVRLALLGRSEPAKDPELAANLDRMQGEAISFLYVSADVADAEAVRTAVAEVEKSLGPVTAILHGAGANLPQSLKNLDESAFLRTLAPKVKGAQNLLAAIHPEKLKLFIAFGSLIARTGLRGEADYAVANEWLAQLTEEWQAGHPDCRCLTVEYSVWSGIGMGQRLGSVDALMQQGITPIPPDEGIAILRRLLASRLPATSIIVTGRYGEAPTLKAEPRELPMLRFIERVRADYPGIELIVDAELSTATDPYLNDHMLGNERIFPGVMGLEAMAQAAMALAERAEPPTFEEVKFVRPIVVPEHSPVLIRAVALVRKPGVIEVALRCEETAFQVDHFLAVCRFADSTAPAAEPFARLSEPINERALMPIDAESDLYGGILFHQGRFKRLRGYRWLKAKECLAEITPDGSTQWFSRYLPASLMLGDPGAHDAAIHAIQACIPHATLIPVGIDKLIQGHKQTVGPWFARALEREHVGDNFTYDLEVTDLAGQLEGRWEGLRLKLVNHRAEQSQWAAPLLGNFIERRVQELIAGAEISVVIEQDATRNRRERSDRAIQRAIGTAVPIRRRPDGKPEVSNGRKLDVSAAHTGDFTIAVAARWRAACDIELVQERPAAMWQDLLGIERFQLAGLIAREAGEDESAAATRIWTAGECLTKAGARLDAPLVLTAATADGWTVLKSGTLTIATLITRIRGIEGLVALAILASSHQQVS